jgi:hypothetical protein
LQSLIKLANALGVTMAGLLAVEESSETSFCREATSPSQVMMPECGRAVRRLPSGAAIEIRCIYYMAAAISFLHVWAT